MDEKTRMEQIGVQNRECSVTGVGEFTVERSRQSNDMVSAMWGNNY
jgi:hypothetical protein